MEVVVIGAHQLESAGARATTLLIDGRLALDAGNLASALTLEEQRRLSAVLLTHYHYDHIRDFPSLAFQRWEHPTLTAYCLPVVRETLCQVFFNDVLWPPLHRIPSPERPAIRFVDVLPYQAFSVEGYEVLVVPANHVAPTVGFRVARDGRSLLYTGDTHGEDPTLWERVRVDVLITEVTFPNRLDEAAVRSKHLTPRRLGRELERYRAVHHTTPRVVAIHRNLDFEAEVRAELEALARDLETPILIPEDGERFTL
ncbi:MAG: MBL fold metallo-hydrolase [Chloroflexi bacterium]|nr:MBL fold metallo-hydrolase [Chloroflexota bacterium]